MSTSEETCNYSPANEMKSPLPPDLTQNEILQAEEDPESFLNIDEEKETEENSDGDDDNSQKRQKVDTKKNEGSKKTFSETEIDNLPWSVLLENSSYRAQIRLTHAYRCKKCTEIYKDYIKKLGKEGLKRKKRTRLAQGDQFERKCVIFSEESFIKLYEEQKQRCACCNDVLRKSDMQLQVQNNAICPTKENLLGLLCKVCFVLWHCVACKKSRFQSYRDLLLGDSKGQPLPFAYSASFPYAEKDDYYLPFKCKDRAKYQDAWWRQGGLATYAISENQLSELPLETQQKYLEDSAHCKDIYDRSLRSKRYWEFKGMMVLQIPLSRLPNNLLSPNPEFFHNKDKMYTLIPTLFLRMELLVGRNRWLSWAIHHIKRAPKINEGDLEHKFWTISETKEKAKERLSKFQTHFIEQQTKKYLQIRKTTKQLAFDKKCLEQNQGWILDMYLKCADLDIPHLPPVDGIVWEANWTRGAQKPLSKDHVIQSTLTVLKARNIPNHEDLAREICDVIYSTRKRSRPMYLVKPRELRALKH